MAEIFSRHRNDERPWVCTVEPQGQIENLLRGEDVRKTRRLTRAPSNLFEPNHARLVLGGIARRGIDEDDGFEVAYSVGQFRRQLMQAEDLNFRLGKFRG